MNWSEIRTWLRRYLRDPNGLIWADAELLQYYNDASSEVAVKSGLVVRVESYMWPPEYDGAYLYDWEVQYGDGTQYQAMLINQADAYVICYPWESIYWLDTAPSADDGYRDIHTWEMCMGNQADVVQVPLHAKFSRMKLCAYDETVIDPVGEHELAQADSYYRTRSGQPCNYWRPDQNQNYLVLYPQPTTVWDETESYEVLDDTSYGLIGSEGWLDASDTGVTTDVVGTENAILMVYEALPTELAQITDEPDVEPYLIKYNCYATLERAYSADTDGFIPTLRDYWGMRKKVGIEAIKKWKRMSKIRQDLRLGGGNGNIRGRHPRLPSHYPAVT